MLNMEAAGVEDELVRNQREIDRLFLRQSILAADFARSQAWEDSGFNGPLDWLRFHCHVTSTVAGSYLAVGENVAQLEQTVGAMDSGEVGFAHLVVMARTADAVGDVFDETKLLAMARETSPGKFHFKCMHYRHTVDARTYADEQAEHIHRNRLSLSTVEDGCLLINGVLDPVGGAAVRSALEPLARPSGEFDERNREERLADALIEISTHRGNRRVSMQVTASVETLLGLVGAPGAESEFTLPISSRTVERWACDCSLTRILMRDSVVIDVGSASRTIRGPRRRALVARDRHCRWPGCDRPASWCDGHHLKHWIHGGGDELDNMILLCHRHHRMVHEHRWQLVVHEDGEVLAIPPITVFGSARGPD
jgi:hypothetical protein